LRRIGLEPGFRHGEKVNVIGEKEVLYDSRFIYVKRDSGSGSGITMGEVKAVGRGGGAGIEAYVTCEEKKKSM